MDALEHGPNDPLSASASVSSPPPTGAPPVAPYVAPVPAVPVHGAPGLAPEAPVYATHEPAPAPTHAAPTHAAPPSAAHAPHAPATGAPNVGAIAAFGETLRQGIRRSMQISSDRLEIVVCSLLAGGHLLLEDQPGVGKTQLARSIASTIDGRFARVQATVDLLPTDILGATVWHAATGTFEFHPGPVFTNVLLVDELNRATPKTQSGLLEAMQELQVTVDGQTHLLAQPFIVVATQNPTAGYDGTYPLPPAQLDRFIARLSLGYPTPAQEAALLRERPEIDDQPLVSLGDLVAAQAATRQVATTEPLLQYVVSVLGATRHHPLTETGASPRAGLQLLSAARARAALQGRDYVLPDDIQALAPAVLAHRIQPVPAAPADAQLTVVADALAQMPAR
ncbi:MAG: MoxR family ATPase [Solirubrobacteraceae bacterium]|nr:MoxR family ATPase [Solirubrobacteraceae bacterium]